LCVSDFHQVSIGEAPLEYKLRSTRREVDGSIHVADDLTRSSAQHRHFVQITEVGGAFIRANKINMVSVRRKRYARELHHIWRQHLHVAPRGHVLHPQALFLRVAQNVNYILAIWRNSHECSLAIVGELGELHALQVETMWPLHQPVSAESQQCD